MATYSELLELSQDASLIGRITAAVAVSAEAIRTESGDVEGHNQRMFWAKQALINPEGEARKIIWLILAQNRAFGVEQIQSASDEAIQNAVNGALVLFL